MMTMTTMTKQLREWWLPCLVVALALLMALPLLLGWHSYVVLSGSMEPHYPVGSLVYVSPVPIETLQKGNVIAFSGAGGVTITHRVLSVDPEARQLVTKGDANESPDPIPVGFDSVLGRAVFCLPFAGYLSLLLRSPLMLIPVVIAAGIAFSLWFYRRFYPADTTPHDKEDTL